jgi:hypothetical protein
METKVWSAANGYPRAVTLFEQRLVLAGTTAFPNRVWASRTGRYNDFTTGSADNDALDLDMVSDQQNPIMQLARCKQLIPLTYGGEFSIRGGVEKPLTRRTTRRSRNRNTASRTCARCAWGTTSFRAARGPKDSLARLHGR